MPHSNWTLFSTHGLVLFHIALRGDSTMREIAEELGITERRVAQIIKDLGDAAMLVTVRNGRRNNYVVNVEAHFRAPPVRDVRIADFLSLASTKVAVA